MKKLILTALISLSAVAQVPPHQCIAFVLNQTDSAFSSMPVRPVFASRVWVACLPKEGVQSYQVEVKSPNVQISPLIQKIDLQQIPGPQMTGSEWQEVLFMQIPITFGPVSEVVVSEVQVLNPRPATLRQ